MRVCADYEDHVTALNAHKALVDNGVEPEDIEIRSPYPLPEEPLPPHRSHKMIMRNIVRLLWLCGVIGGFTFVSYTQWEWGTVAKTDGHPLIAIPLTAVIMYECGMLTAIWVNTFMFFIETFRYRELVPPPEEDMPVARGYIALVVRGASVEKAKKILSETKARSLVTYALPLVLLAVLSNGCATANMRYQDVIKPTEQAAALPPPHSLPMPDAEELQYPPPPPYGYLEAGDPIEYAKLVAKAKALSKQADDLWKKDKAKARELQKEARKLRNEAKDVAPEYLLMKRAGTAPPELASFANPVEPTDLSLERGERLYARNCSHCHGLTGKGDGPVGQFTYVPPKPIGTAQYLDKLTDGQFYYYIATGLNLMPEFAYKLSPRDIWDIINYLRHLQQQAAK